MSKPSEMIINGHAYEFHPLEYDEALSISSELGAGLLPSLGALLEGPPGAAIGGDLAVEDLLDMGLDALKGLDFAAVGQSMAAALRGGALSPSLVRRALASTLRDGVPLVGDDFDEAYRGHLLESLVAAFHAVRANGLFESPSISAA